MSPNITSDKDDTAENGHEWFIPEDGRKHLEELFAKFTGEVRFAVFTQEGVNDPYNEYTHKFIGDLVHLGDKVTAEYHELGSDAAKEHEVKHSPTLLINPGEYNLRFTGAPLGEEGRALVETMLYVSAGKSTMSETSRQVLAELATPRTIKVFTTPG